MKAISTTKVSSSGLVGFQIEARGLFDFVVCSHGVYRIADWSVDTVVKFFRILAKWLVIVPLWRGKCQHVEKLDYGQD